MYLRPGHKAAGFALNLIIPALPLLGYKFGTAWLTPLLFFLIFPVIGRVLKGDQSPALSPIALTSIARIYYRWLPRLYLPLWLLCLSWTIQTISKTELPALTVLGLCLSASIVSAMASPVSHELLHRESLIDEWLARLMVTLVAYPHYIREHMFHHRHVGLPHQSLSAAVGENLWQFLARVLPEGFKAAGSLESEILDLRKKSRWHSTLFLNRLIVALWLGLFLIFGGYVGLFVYVVQAVFTIFAIQAVNYIQHYGLARLPGDAISSDLTWEDNCLIANCLTFNINHHSQHHREPSLPFFSLELDRQSPRLPGGYMVMLLVAMYPRLWIKIMDKRLIDYLKQRDNTSVRQEGDCLEVLGHLIR